MYLKKVYKYHKGWFVFVTFFAVGQLYINYKKGVVFSPFYHYGMYSGKINPQDEYQVPAIKVNGKKLMAQNFSPQQWDNIVLPVTMFLEQKEWNHYLWQIDIKRMLHLTDSTKYVNSLTVKEFDNWYHSYLAGKLNYRVDSVTITQDVYRDDKLNSIKSDKN